MLRFRSIALGFLLAQFYGSEPLLAYGLEVGLAAVDGGDDRAEPAAVARADLASGYFTQMLLYGRSFGPVTDRTVILTLGRELSVKGIDRLRACVGVSGMDEYTGVYTSARTLPDGSTQQPIKDNQYNLGGLLGLRYELLPKSRFKASLGWESHLFLAGEAGILLDFGIKQVWSFTTGVDL